MVRWRHIFLKLRIRSLQFDIVTAFMGVLIVTLALLMTHTFRRNSEVIVEFSRNFMHEVGRVAVVNAVDLLDDARDATAIGASFINSKKDVSIGNANLVSALLNALTFNQNLTFYGVATVDGHMMAATKVREGATFQNTTKPLPSSYEHIVRIIEINGDAKKEVWGYYDKNKTKLFEESVTSDYDPRERDWYIKTSTSRKTEWSDVYFFYTTKTYGLTVSMPIYSPNNTFIGVFESDVSLDDLSTFTEQQKISKSGVEVILSRDGKIIAAPRSIIDLHKQRNGKYPTLAKVKDARIVDAFSYHEESGEDDFVYKSGREKYLATITTFPKRIAQDWVILVIAPLNEFLGEILTIQKHNIYISIGIFAIAAFFIVLMSKRISKPIKKLAHSIDEIKHFRLSEKISIHSYIKEIRQITYAVVSMKNAIKSFSRFVPKQIVEKLVVKGRSIELGGETKKLTIFFSDITNFTRLSEGMPSADLMRHISHYLDELSQIIMNEHGTIDKYIGDSIMAFWGAPDDDPNDALNATKTALLCQHKLTELNSKWQEEGKPVLHTRVGIHRGEVIVGNIGTRERMNYTVIGDNVNLASRLESVNKFYSTDIIISEEVYKELDDSIITRPLDVVAVKGKLENTKIYEVLMDRELAIQFTKAYSLFHNKEYERAKEAFLIIQKAYPDDKPTHIYLERLKDPDSWSGILKLETK